MNTDIINLLTDARSQLLKQLAAIDQALNALGGHNGGPRKGRRRLSAEARNRIIAAQKKRWVAWKRQKGKR
jgi:hypothetical protein